MEVGEVAGALAAHCVAEGVEPRQVQGEDERYETFARIREQLLTHLAERFFERDRSSTEREVDEALSTVHEDCAALRRYLVVSGLLVRPRDGSSYRRGR
ncbi:DUF2087 domain-containing protein [Streptomyces sp. NPDC014622]|uniref:DUF2087 domain-containing protein n=1 Tax=Streptomyces sp. NPDC014622 TaxID=3364874 RepID=UPI0036FDF79E